LIGANLSGTSFTSRDRLCGGRGREGLGLFTSHDRDVTEVIDPVQVGRLLLALYEVKTLDNCWRATPRSHVDTGYCAGKFRYRYFKLELGNNKES